MLAARLERWRAGLEDSDRHHRVVFRSRHTAFKALAVAGYDIFGFGEITDCL